MLIHNGLLECSRELPAAAKPGALSPVCLGGAVCKACDPCGLPLWRKNRVQRIWPNMELLCLQIFSRCFLPWWPKTVPGIPAPWEVQGSALWPCSWTGRQSAFPAQPLLGAWGQSTPPAGEKQLQDKGSTGDSPPKSRSSMPAWAALPRGACSLSQLTLASPGPGRQPVLVRTSTVRV